MASGVTTREPRSSGASLVLRVVASPLVLVLLAGCGVQTFPQPAEPGEAAAIVKPPTDASIPMGLSAKLTVSAIGSTPLHYRWYKNGTPVPDSDLNPYTTPPLQFDDDGSTYAVTVSNAYGSTTSQPATLNVTARAPKLWDLRFQQVDAPETVNGYGGGVFTYLLGRLGLSFSNEAGTPLGLGAACTPGGNSPYACIWPLSASFPASNVSGLTISYLGDYLHSFDADLDAIVSDPQTVVTSLDIHSQYDSFAISYIQTTQTTGFTMEQHTIPAAELASDAAREGAQGRIITALSFVGSQVEYFSYGWREDQTGVYQTEVLASGFDDVASAASELAASGYILTALGGNMSDGFLLVGTKLNGDTMPRPFLALPTGRSGAEAEANGYATVGLLNDDKVDPTWLYER